MKKIEFDHGNFTVLKVVQIEDINKFQYFSGYVYYLRELTKEYNESTPDFIDDMILGAIRNIYPESRLVFNRNMLFKGQKDESLLDYSGKKDLDFKITFMPNVPYDKYDVVNTMKLYSYTKKLFLIYNSMTNSGLELFINTHVQAEIPFDKIEEFNDKIGSVIFK